MVKRDPTRVDHLLDGYKTRYEEKLQETDALRHRLQERDKLLRLHEERLAYKERNLGEKTRRKNDLRALLKNMDYGPLNEVPDEIMSENSWELEVLSDEQLEEVIEPGNHEESAFVTNLVQQNFGTKTHKFLSESEISEIESIKSIEEDILSSLGSVSSTSTNPSIRLVAIETLVNVILRDKDLYGLYSEAVERLDKEIFIRNQG